MNRIFVLLLPALLLVGCVNYTTNNINGETVNIANRDQTVNNNADGGQGTEEAQHQKKVEQPVEPINGQVTIKVRFFDDKSDLKNRIEANLSELFTRFYNAYNNGTVLNLVGIDMNTEARNNISELWNNKRFQLFSLSYQNAGIARVGNKSEYVVFNLPISEEGVPDRYEDYYVHFDSNGRIIKVAKNPCPPPTYPKSKKKPSPEIENYLRKFIYDLEEAYNSKDIASLRIIYDPDGWCVVGEKVSSLSMPSSDGYRVVIDNNTYKMFVRKLKDYLDKLELVFNNGYSIHFRYSNPEIYEHENPSQRFDKVYFISMKQKYTTTSSYGGDCGWLLLCVDLKDLSNPKIRYRIWWPDDVDDPYKIISTGMF